MTEEVQQIRRLKSREYRKNGKSDKFVMLHEKFLNLKDKNSRKFIQKQVENLKDIDPRKFYQKIKILGDRLGETSIKKFTIPTRNNMWRIVFPPL